MKVDISFPFAKVYDISKADVVLGQKFTLLTDDESPDLSWFSDKDKVLAIDDSGPTAEIEATSKGVSRIKISNRFDEVLKEVTINVVDAIAEPAKDLGLSADPAIPKTP